MICHLEVSSALNSYYLPLFNHSCIHFFVFNKFTSQPLYLQRNPLSNFHKSLLKRYIPLSVFESDFLSHRKNTCISPTHATPTMHPRSKTEPAVTSIKMAEFFNLANYDSQPKAGFKAFEIAPVIERIVTTSADRPKMVCLSLKMLKITQGLNLYSNNLYEF